VGIRIKLFQTLNNVFFLLVFGSFDLSYSVFVICALYVFIFFDFISFSFVGAFLCDGIRFFLVSLSCLVFLFSLFSVVNDYFSGGYFYTLSFLLISIFLFVFLCFLVVSVLLFYMFFELVFLMLFTLLLGWGVSPIRSQASFYMVFYTLVVSLPFFIFFVYFSYYEEVSNFFSFGSFNGLWWFFLVIVFLVKLPIFGTHLWLPKAHVEAPLPGSMILAGVLLKIGVYGLIRLIGLCYSHIITWGGYVFSFGLVGGLVCCLICVRQVDLKSLVAYSSICHMGVSLRGILAPSGGLKGCILMRLAHGLGSPCIFYLVYVFL